METTRHSFDQLSRRLLRDFLLLERIGYDLPGRIVLCGGSREVLKQMARVIKEELAACRRKVKVLTSRRRAGASVEDGKYYIDVDYFEGKEAL
jgi:hypothetical protein